MVRSIWNCPPAIRKDRMISGKSPPIKQRRSYAYASKPKSFKTTPLTSGKHANQTNVVILLSSFRIKLNTQNELLVVPLEVEVTPDGELVHPQGGVDFGIGGNLDPPKEVKLCVSNPQKRSVRVHSVSTTSKAIDVNYEPVRIMPDAEDRGACTNIATLTLNCKFGCIVEIVVELVFVNREDCV